MWTLFEVIVNLYQAFLMLHFLKGRLHMKCHAPVAGILCIAVTASLMSINTFSIAGIMIPDGLFFIVPLVYTLFVMEDKWYISVFWTSVLMLVFFLTVSLSLHLFTTLLRVTYDEMMQKTGWRILFVM